MTQDSNESPNVHTISDNGISTSNGTPNLENGKSRNSIVPLNQDQRITRMLSNASASSNNVKMQWGSIWIATVILFLVAVQFSIYFASLWPYMSQIDKTADQTFYGFTLASYSLGQMISSPVLGYWNNKLRRARPVILVGVCFSMSGSLVYMFTESVPNNRKWIILAARFLNGLGGGVAGTIRGYLATSSTLEQRARAIAIGTAALSLGVTAGPIVQACVTPIGYPGLVLGPLHISQYTAPSYVSVCAGIILLTFLFTVFKENYIGIDDRKKTNPYHFIPNHDKKASLLCILCWFAMFFCVTNSETVESPYTMAVYGWSNSDAVFYNSIIMACSSFVSFSMYTFFAIYGKRLNERLCITIGLCMLWGFYVITFPWPFFTGKLSFKSVNSTVSPVSAMASNLSSAVPFRDVGCDLSMEWCNYTPKLPLIIFLMAYPLVSVGFPSCNVALSTLLSKILGPRRQGFMQSLMIMTGSGARLLGPILISWLFADFGPRIAWTMTAGVVSISITVFLIHYNRMIPLITKPKLKSGQKLRYDGGTLYHF